MSKFDRRRPGRPRDTRDKYLDVLQAMAEYMCLRKGSGKGRSIKAVAAYGHDISPDHLSVRQLERLYAKYGRELEIEYMRGKHPTRWAYSARSAEDLIEEDERAATLARDLVPRIPPHRWYPAELEEFFVRVRLLERE